MATFKDPNVRPQVEPPDLDMIPDYVKALPHWVLWRFDWNVSTEQWAKVPYSPKTLSFARSNDKQTWIDFDSLREVYIDNQVAFDGVGFVFTGDDDLCGVDFDNCVVDTGSDFEVSEKVLAWVGLLDSYTELSVTGTGLHVILRGVIGGGRKDNKTNVEIYDRVRYFAFSGRSWHENPRLINWRQSQLDNFKSLIFPDREPNAETKKRPPVNVQQSTDELLRLAFSSKNGDSVFRLYQGRIDDYDGDDSAADLALCSKLAFWSGGDIHLLDEMFRGSRLYRDKWDKKHSADGRTYGEMTLEKAMANCSTFFGQEHDYYNASYYKANGNRHNGNGHTPSVDESDDTKTDEVKQRPGIYRVRDLRDKVFELFEKGRQPGELPGWRNLNDLYTVKRKQFTVITGVPGAGKSAFLDCLIMNLASNSSWRFAITSVENQPIEDHISVLSEIYTGMPFNKGERPRMSFQLLDESLKWFDEHFIFVLPEEEYRTLPGIIELVDYLSVDGVVVDPWNELEHRRPPMMSETEYISRELSRMRYYARQHDQHWWLVAHPTKLQKDKEGRYVVPTLYDISGSAHFRNKADMGLVVYRDDTETDDAPSTIFIQKVRFRWCGKRGQCSLYYNRVTGQFFESSFERDRSLR